MIQRAWLFCAASSLASIATASPMSETTMRNFVLDGEILVYSPNASGLPVSTVVAPRGARNERDLLLKVQTIAAATPDLARFESGPLVHGTEPLVIGEQGAKALTLGDLSLQLHDGRWTFFGNDGELMGRPIFALAPESTPKRLSEFEFTLTGELMLDEAMAAELGLSQMYPPPHIVGSAVIHGASYPGTDYTAGAPAAKSTPTIGTSALSVVGPDVIVSTIGPSFTEYGASAGIGAYAVTTVSCNIGTQDAIWIDCTSGPQCNQHPVIGTQIYRLKSVAGATRFEQIGMSWLKHGFCAADAPNCGTPYVGNGSCDWLGLFATDTYGSGLNASQPGCGPRSEINAWTGVYPYPYVLGAGTGSPGGIFKRCQVLNSDLDPAQNAGASYLCDVVYICTDEPDANKYNNYSNRACTVGAFGVQYNLEFTGGTNTQQSALERWPIIDPGVTLVNVDVPGDGRFVVGAKVTDLGGGTWHYEYAILNMNCHDSARRITVPADLTVQVAPASIGFHDVPYHSGEPYSGTDWTQVRNTSNVEWTTDTFTVNQNANALRWSTTYNFRFDANIAPVSGDIEIGLFRSGGTATAVGVPVPGSFGLPTPYCFGDGSGTACPCANNGAAGNGCAHSLNAAGANLAGSGLPRISADTFVLTTTGMPSGPGLYFQGDAIAAGGNGFAFGDGLLCASGAIIRLGVKFAVAGTSVYPDVGDPTLSVAGSCVAGNTRFYQKWFRDAAPFCTVATYNLTSAIQITWVP
jgi:hypothetical protein